MSQHLLSLDQGTTGSTALILDAEARILGKATREFQQHYPQPGLVEHEPEEIWASVLEALAAANSAAGVDGTTFAGIGITNQRETTVVWEKSTGRAIHRAIVWQDRRTADACAALKSAGLEDMFRAKTGLVLDPYFSGTKVAWILDNVAGARARAEAGELLFGTIDSWLVYRLSAGEVHVTDVTNASRTLLFDIHTGAWDAALAKHLNVPLKMLPKVASSSEVYARTRNVKGIADGTPIAGIAGDQQAALFGQTCFGVGEAKCTYGTGAFLLMNTGTSAVASKHGLLTTIAWKLGNTTTYALEGSAFIAGAAVQWLRDGLGIIKSASEVEALARTVASAGDVVFVPALAGLGAPHWDPHARGLIYGLSRDTNKGHIARATLEGIALQIVDLVSAMSADAGKPLSRMRVDGGAASNELLMQFQSDILGVHVDRPRSVETTALGAAYLAGLAVGVFRDLDAVKKAHHVEKTFAPEMSERDRSHHLVRWQRAVDRTRSELRSS